MSFVISGMKRMEMLILCLLPVAVGCFAFLSQSIFIPCRVSASDAVFASLLMRGVSNHKNISISETDTASRNPPSMNVKQCRKGKIEKEMYFMFPKVFYGPAPRFTQLDKAGFDHGDCRCTDLFVTTDGKPVVVARNERNGIWSVLYGFSTVVFADRASALDFCRERFKRGA